MPEAKHKILVCNAGSSSLKFSLFDAEDEVLLADGGVDWLRKPARLVFRGANQPEIREELKLEKHADAVARILDDLQAGASAPLQSPEDLRAVGHRVVHGGDRYTTAVRINAEVKRTIEELTELAPLHNPPSLDGINAVEQRPAKGSTGSSIRHRFPCDLVRGCPNLSVAAKVDTPMGHPPLRFPWTEPFLLHWTGGEDNRSARFAARYCASREWRFGICSS